MILTIANPEIENEIKSFITVLSENNIQVDKVILFGSHAKGIAKSYSDIDLAIVSPQFGKDEIEEMMTLSKLSWKVSDRIESIPLTEKDLQMKYHPFIGEIKKYGKVVYDSTVS